MSNIHQISSDFYWLGALDPNLRTFDIVMETEFGTSYNAYLLKTTDGVILFETVKEKFFEDYFEKLTSLVSLVDIKYIIVNHTEPDHAGSVSKLIERVPHITVVGSQIAIKNIGHMIHASFNSLSVKDGQTLTLGNKTVRFISSPQLHWPDTMYSYIEEDKFLITCDSFGAHYCDSRLYRSALEPEKDEAYLSSYQYYYDNIMGPFKPFVLKALDKIKPLEINLICPGHGMILDPSNISYYLDLYEEWSQPVIHSPRIVIAYVSAYGYTKQLAHAIYDGIKASGYTGDVDLFDLEVEPIDKVLAVVNTAQGLLVGSSTILGDTLPPIWQLLTTLNPILHKHLYMGCFGSYGWSGEALSNIETRIKQLKCTMPLAPLGVIFRPNQEDLEKASNFGKQFVEALTLKSK